MEDLTGFQRDALYVIAGLDEPYGLAIKAELEEYYDKEIHHGRLYPNLDILADKGLVKKGQYDDRTNSFELSGCPVLDICWHSPNHPVGLCAWQPGSIIEPTRTSSVEYILSIQHNNSNLSVIVV